MSVEPPMHSVTSWPVISKCTPPGCVPSARCTAKKSFTSRRIASKWRVLRPLAAVTVLPCMGSHDQTTDLPARSTARTSGGSFSATLSAPMRTMRTMRPASFAGLSVSIRRSVSSTESEGPHLKPIGLRTPRRNSTCAPSGWRVRSPIHSMWAEQSYQSPEVESTRVSASS